MTLKTVQVGIIGGRTAVTFDDWVLADWFDDFLCEQHGIDYEFSTEAEAEGKEGRTLHFSSEVSFERILRLVKHVERTDQDFALIVDAS